MFLALLGAVDKVELATGALYGFKTDNHLVGQQYSWLGSILSVGVSSFSLYSISFQYLNLVADARGDVSIFLSRYETADSEIYGFLFHCLVNLDLDDCSSA